MLYVNGNIFLSGSFQPGSFRTKDGLFTEVSSGSEAKTETLHDTEGVTDLLGKYVIPGLIDIHTHGNSGADFSDGDPGGLDRMASYLAENGVTSFAPASMTLPESTLREAFKNAREFHDSAPEKRSRLMGIHMEGPFFSREKRGAQNEAFLKAPDQEMFLRLQEAAGGLIRIADLAPELPGAADFARTFSGCCTISAAHTAASYEEAAAFFDAGAAHLTHLFNAMPRIHHRDPGVIGAASERENVIAELICDGFHVHPSAVRMAFRLFPKRICLISDAFRGAGMPDGEYSLGGQPVFLKCGKAVLEGGTLAGSASNLYQCMLNAVRFGIPKEEAVLAATLLPAREIRAEDLAGSIAPGKYADFVICTEDLAREAVYIGGKQI